MIPFPTKIKEAGIFAIQDGDWRIISGELATT